ncbi:hypothetical protein C4D60_Mb08t17900 [Musa balbisiana]|uniref:Uncharacterized protein n=1 Tax=Musa balbisiana TaxID=52838 RepID=A0A4S8K4M0_MUSBA|nr:hypothetical protein C4D60_Mb08t17900 [Musa balbisiana]
MGNSTHLLHRLPPDLVPVRLVGNEADALNLAVVAKPMMRMKASGWERSVLAFLVTGKADLMKPGKWWQRKRPSWRKPFLAASTVASGGTTGWAVQPPTTRDSQWCYRQLGGAIVYRQSVVDVNQ